MSLTKEDFLQTCRVVEGYIDLGLVEDGRAIIESLPDGLKKGKRATALLITLLEKQGDFLEASYLAEGLSLNEPENIEHMLLVARYRFQAGKVVDALWWLQAYATRCSKSPKYHYFRAECHAAVGDPEAARHALKEALQLEQRPRWHASAEDDQADNVFYTDSFMTETR